MSLESDCPTQPIRVIPVSRVRPSDSAEESPASLEDSKVKFNHSVRDDWIPQDPPHMTVIDNKRDVCIAWVLGVLDTRLSAPVANSGDMTPGGLSDLEPSEEDPLQKLKYNVFMDPNIPLQELINKSDYLQKYPSWLGYCGTENKRKFAPTFIARNDTIWELIFSERGFVDMLLMVRDVYMAPFPEFEPNTVEGCPADMSSASLRAALFPGLEELISAHERILRPLLALHDQAEDRVVTSLGPCLVKLFDKDTQDSLSKLYGGFMFAQKRIREQLQRCKRLPLIAQFFVKCQQDPRSARKSLDDCHMVIVQRWTKVETLLEAIIKNTLNRPSEVADLESARNAVRHILKAAEAMMTQMEHKEKLRDFADHLVVPSPSYEDEKRLLDEMSSPGTTLINYGPLRVNSSMSGQQGSATAEVIGVALNSCFFMLQKAPDSNRYQLFRGTQMPPILWWGQVYGYFRKSMEKGGFGFFILLHSNAVLTLFRCSTVDELIRWENIMNNGFAQWRESEPKTIESLDLELSKSRSSIAERWQRTQAIIDLLRDQDADCEQAWEARVFVCAALIKERLKAIVSAKPPEEQQKRPQEVDSDYSSAGTYSGSNIAGHFRGPHRSSSGASTTSQNQPKAASTPTATDILRSETFIADLEPTKDLDQWFAVFQETFTRLSFALIGGNSSGLSRSASDVDERKRPSVRSIRKNETFSVRDSVLSPNDPKSESSSKSHSRKREAYRLSSTVASIFRSGNREKSGGGGPVQQSSIDASPTSSSSGYQKCSRTRPHTASSGQRSAHSSVVSSNPLPPTAPSRSSLAYSGYENQLTCDSLPSTDGSRNGSCNSLISQPPEDALNLLGNLNQCMENLYPYLLSLRTDNIQLKADLQSVQKEKEALANFRNNVVQCGLHVTADGSGPSVGGDSEGTLTVKQETEKLRQDYENFTRKSEEWEKEYQRQRDLVEREHTKLARERVRLEDERADLERRQRQYEENCKTLQQQIDLHASRGVKFTGVVMPGLQLPDQNASHSSPGMATRLGESSSLKDLFSPDAGGRNSSMDRSPVHFHSASDDITMRSSQTGGGFSGSSSTLSPGLFFGRDEESTPRPSLVPSGSVRSAELPEHLRGSLLNQPQNSGEYRSSDCAPGSRWSGPASDYNRSASISISNPNTSSSSLMKLADSSKVRSGSKSKRSGLFRLH
ncbi:unnamed protein product [Calicophoron daubneyi]|uniref:DH domain-containing protein n=1 Tax=Calicophoron daubneyi TaxID=300641 RepID=A0AAV2T7I7_CALDB